MRVLVSVLGCLFIFSACGESGVVVPVSDTAATDMGGVDTVAPEDTSLPDLGEPDSAPDASTSCESGEGCFGEPCDSSDDCLSGICTMHMGEKVCSKTCDANCPDGWSCTLVGGGGDGQYVCLSNFSHLCLPCTDAGTCSGETPNACVKYDGGTSFCGGACAADVPCPSGYECQKVETTEGASSYQCIRTEGACECSQLAISSALATGCANTNEFGTCEGVRICEETGLSDCSAAMPAEEICNGIDDDCDGQTDEDLCDDENPCTEDVCGGEAGCSNTPLEGAECLDGDACTVADHCEAGDCVGTPVTCDDNNPCTEDSCDGTGGCTFTPIAGGLCDDGDACTLGDVCNEGACTPSVTLDCDDGNVCTVGSCGDTGCVFEATDADCDDGNACTEADVCSAGTCAGTTLNCDDGNLCTNESCDPASGCVITNNTNPCDDGDSCTVNDTCAEGACVSGTTLDCDDGNPCTIASCKDGGCIFEMTDAPCDDGNACTVISACDQGACKGEVSLPCDDNNPCTDDSCDIETGCDHTPNENPCSDSDACTVGDTCAAGSCVSGAALSCDDGNPCTDNACDAATGCTSVANAKGCDDGTVCTTGDTCTDGACVAQGILLCGDGNDCTEDACDPKEGCTQTPIQGDCDDGNVCTKTDVCMSGTCMGEDILACDDGETCTLDTCDPVKGCVHAPNNAVCDDDNQCTLNDACSEGTCMSGPALECDDGNVCTLDTCDPATGCEAEPAPADCDDGNICTENDQCADGSCAPGTPKVCEDGDPCTPEVCDPEDGCKVVLNDPDNDGVDASCDNCPEVSNPDQTDNNNNNVGDVCEEGCLKDWQVGIPCNPIHGSCTSEETGYHFKGIYNNGGQKWACWWHTKNQGWMNQSINFYKLAEHFGLEPNGGAQWCHPFSNDPCASGACQFVNQGYFDQSQTDVWGWCGGAPFTSGGFVCIPASNKIACP